MSKKTDYYIKLSVAVLLFTCSGLASSYLYYRYGETGGVFFPGLLYTSVTILVFVLTKTTFSTKGFWIYYLLMNLTYLVIWFLTMASSWFAFLGGIVTAGAGAIITFILVNKFIVKIRINMLSLFITGGSSFLVIDILYFTFGDAFNKIPAEYIFKVEVPPGTLFFEVFIFWHVLVGTKLFLTLSKPGEGEQAAEKAGS